MAISRTFENYRQHGLDHGVIEAGYSADTLGDGDAELTPKISASLFNKYHAALDNSEILTLPVMQAIKGAVRLTVGAITATLVAAFAAAYFGFGKFPDMRVARDAFAMGLADMAQGLAEILHMKGVVNWANRKISAKYGKIPPGMMFGASFKNLRGYHKSQGRWLAHRPVRGDDLDLDLGQVIRRALNPTESYIGYFDAE